MALQYGIAWDNLSGTSQSCVTTGVSSHQQVYVHHVIHTPKNHCENCGAPPQRHSPDCSYCGADDMFA